MNESRIEKLLKLPDVVAAIKKQEEAEEKTLLEERINSILALRDAENSLENSARDLAAAASKHAQLMAEVVNHAQVLDQIKSNYLQALGSVNHSRKTLRETGNREIEDGIRRLSVVIGSAQRESAAISCSQLKKTQNTYLHDVDTIKKLAARGDFLLGEIPRLEAARAELEELLVAVDTPSNLAAALRAVLRRTGIWAIDEENREQTLRLLHSRDNASYLVQTTN